MTKYIRTIKRTVVSSFRLGIMTVTGSVWSKQKAITIGSQPNNDVFFASIENNEIEKYINHMDVNRRSVSNP